MGGRTPTRPTRRTTLIAIGVSAVVLVLAAALTWALIGHDDETTSGSSLTVARDAARTTTTRGSGCDPAGVIERWPLRQRLNQLVMVGVSGTDADEARAAASRGLGGVYVRRPGTATYTSGVLEELRTPEGIPLSVAVDDEGGRVQSIEPLAGDLPSARLLGQRTPTEIEALARERGAALGAVGVTVVFAPVADVSDQADGEVIGDRSYSSDPAEVATDADAYARGLEAAGLTAVVKHFPGHGRAEGDSHEGSTIAPPLESLRSVDLVPYRTLLSDDRWVMIGHLVVPGLTDDVPASLSPQAIDGLLRDELDFDGVVISDELGGMRAVSDGYPLPEAALRHLTAGGDIALWSDGGQADAVVDHLEAAVGDGSFDGARVNASVGRVLRAKGFDPCAADSVRDRGP